MVKGKKANDSGKKLSVYDREKERERQKNIKLLQELESSSCSSSSSGSTYSFVSMHESYEDEEDAHDILDNLYDTDNESLQEEEPEYTQCKPLEEKMDFFQYLGEIPDVDNVSEDITIASIKIEKPETDLPDGTKKDLGKFVDPLTGGDIRSSQESQSTEEASDDAALDANLDDDMDDGNVSEDAEMFLPDDTLEEDDDIKKVTEAEDALENFLEMEAHKRVTEFEVIDWEAVAKEQEAKRVHQYTLEFITELIKRVVDAVEYVSPETILRQNLDKRKLIHELIAKLPSYAVEKSVRAFLNRKVVEYYRRKKSFRPIMPDHPKTLIQDNIKFRTAAKRLDHLLEKEDKLNSTTTEIIENLKKEYNEAKQEADAQVQLFTRMVKTNLCRESNPKTNAVIEQLLSRMNKYRKEVNEVRFLMFTNQHSKARLTEALSKLEDLGNGLSMRDFGTLQAETQTLGKKIEERNVELNKLHIRCRSDIHTMAHYKEKQNMLRNVIAIQKSVLDTMSDNKYGLRERVHHLKLIHKGVRSEIADLSFQGGLLDKPALMFDYDATDKRLNEQHAIIDDLRKTLMTTQNKIEAIVKLCPELKMK